MERRVGGVRCLFQWEFIKERCKTAKSLIIIRKGMQKQGQLSECILCYEEATVIGLLPCNHRLICHSCVMKLFDNGFCVCPICKAASKAVLFTTGQADDYDQVVRGSIFKSETRAGFMYASKEARAAVQRENLFICSFSSCGHQYGSLNALKRHLNEVHRRQFCDLCLDSRKCLLSEQILYSEPELSSHLADGEIEETGVVSLYHPFCEFCRQRSYDEDSFLRHLKTHEQCHICNKKPEMKYVYYKDMKTLESHFDASHYMCKHNNCLDRKLLNVFATEDLRDFHYAQVHLGQNFSKKARRNIECMELTGFNQTEDHEEKVKDGYGKNFAAELMSISRKVQLTDQNHFDGGLDIRQLLTDRTSHTRHMGVLDIANRVKDMLYALEGQALYLDDLDLFKPLTMKSLPKAMLHQLIDEVYVYQRGNHLKRLFFDGLTDIKSYEDYCHNLDVAVSYGSPLLFFYVFPQLVRFFKDTNDRKAYMDAYYLRRLLELPTKTPSLITECKTYGQFTRNFRGAIEQVITRRIQSNKIDLKVYLQLLNAQGDYKHKDSFFVPKDKIKHLYHMIEKVRTRELLRLNWLLKVGLPLPTHQYMLKKVYLSPQDKLPEMLCTLTNNELALLYCYFRIVEQAFAGKVKFNFEKSKEDANLLRELLLKNKDRYGKALPQYEDIQKHQHEKVHKKIQKVVKITNDQADLPELPSKAVPVVERSEPTLQVGFGSSKTNFKKWDEQSRKKLPPEPHVEENEARNKVFDHLANKTKKKNKDPPSPIQPVKTPEPPVKMPPRPLTDAEQLKLAIEESKKSFESQRRRRQQLQEEQEKARQNELDRETKQLKAKKEHDKAEVEKEKQKEKEKEKSSPIKQEPSTPKKQSGNIFDQLECEEQEIKMQKATKKQIKPESKEPNKPTQKMTMKNLSKENPSIHSTPTLSEDTYPSLGNKKAKFLKSEMPVPQEDFPELSGTKEPASWIEQVAVKTKDPVHQEVKVRKKKGRTTIEQTVDIFGRN